MVLFSQAQSTTNRCRMALCESFCKRHSVLMQPYMVRSTFKDWAAETTNHSNEVSEMALAHTISSKTEAAYRRGDLIHKRRELMEDWSNFLCRGRKR